MNKKYVQNCMDARNNYVEIGNMVAFPAHDCGNAMRLAFGRVEKCWLDDDADFIKVRTLVRDIDTSYGKADKLRVLYKNDFVLIKED